MIILIFHSTQKKPETISRPPEFDSDDAFEQLADITIGAEDSDTNVKITQPVEETCQRKESMRTKEDIQEPRTGKIIGLLCQTVLKVFVYLTHPQPQEMYCDVVNGHTLTWYRCFLMNIGTE